MFRKNWDRRIKIRFFKNGDVKLRLARFAILHDCKKHSYFLIYTRNEELCLYRLKRRPLWHTCTLWTHMVGICQCTLHIGKIFCLNMAFLDNYLCEYILYLGTHLYIVAVNHNFTIFAPLPHWYIYIKASETEILICSRALIWVLRVFLWWATEAYSAALCYDGLLLPIWLPYYIMGYCCLFGCLMLWWASVAYSTALL